MRSERCKVTCGHTKILQNSYIVLMILTVVHLHIRDACLVIGTNGTYKEKINVVTQGFLLHRFLHGRNLPF